MPDQRFRLNAPTIGILRSGTDGTAITIPAGEIIVVSSSTEKDGMVTVRWADKSIEMFAVDIRIRGTLVAAQPGG